MADEGASTKYTGPYAIVSWEGNRDASNNNAMDGWGKITFANTNTYEGFVSRDMLHGRGVLHDHENHTRFEGMFCEDKRHGENCIFTHPFGRYEGSYANNKRHGRGKEVDLHGNTFEGEFRDGDAYEGRATFVDGEVYVGRLRNDMKDGYGKLWTQDGELLEGEWKEDELVAPA